MVLKKSGEKKEYKGFFGRHRLWVASATLMGTVIGAGVLGIPYVIAQSGILLGIINILVLGFVLLILHLCMGEISLRTKGIHQLSGYMQKYLGRPGKYFMTFSMVVGIYGALIAYIIGEGSILNTLFGGFPPWIFSLVFFVVVSFFLIRGLKATGRAEFIVAVLMMVVVLVIAVFSVNKINPSFLGELHWANIFLPYGVILFAFVGTAAIPELKVELNSHKKQMKKAILIGSILPIMIYLIFSIVVAGIVGLENFNSLPPNDRIATIALGMFTNKYLYFGANIFAVLAMFTSFIGLGLALKEMFKFDYKLSELNAFILTVFPPLVIALSGFTNFIAVIGFSGAVAGGVDGVLIMAAYWKAKKKGQRKPEYSINIGKFLTGIIICIFIAGVVYQLWSILF